MFSEEKTAEEISPNPEVLNQGATHPTPLRTWKNMTFKLELIWRLEHFSLRNIHTSDVFCIIYIIYYSFYKYLEWAVIDFFHLFLSLIFSNCVLLL